MHWYPHYITDYRRDTLHLTTLQHGAYRLLIDAYMEFGRSLPDDDAILARLSGLALNEWLDMATVIRAFFVSAGTTLKHKRCEAELNEQSRARLKWARDKARQRARKALDLQDRVREDSTRTVLKMSSDRTGQDSIEEGRKKEVASLVSQAAKQGEHGKVNGASYDEPAVRKQRWVQKIADELGRTLPTERAEKIILGYQRGEQWARAEFERVDKRIKERRVNGAAGGR